ncbi:hypothetical protein BS47DRAFT_1482838 [Hydnum rufescens UP504]|uniref:FAD dependent oxidoreductase domain-containing protein n=1 Tax=Hydnum rufescens UP504 TaxID=1448309 RepID=A0A9P6DY53_9AGAM|nr:hypothetical protein BS47DRAFT_1482838 [Hydnum rufescens UP504]
MSEHVVVIGAGVIGLTAALRLAESGYSVSIVARDLPSDSNSQQFASPWAGANWHSFCTAEDERQCRWETITFKKVWSLIPSGVAMKLDGIDYYTKPFEPLWFKDLCPNYRLLDSSQLPPNINHGVAYTTWSVNSPLYIKWLEARLKALGVAIIRATVQAIEQPFLESFDGQPIATLVVNASGLGSRSLIGVEDEKVHPIRGQTVLIWAPHVKKTITVLGHPEIPPTYIIPRPSGEVILGGTFGVNDWNLSPDPSTTERIVRQCLAIEPSLSFDEASTNPENIPIIKVNVGLRPARAGGARLEREKITVPLEQKPFSPMGSNVTKDITKRTVDVIHAYGLGPTGFQASWGVAEDVVSLVRESFAERK